MKTTITMEEILSEEIVEKLNTTLMKGNMEELKKQMVKLFTFKSIFELHDDHIKDLSECVIDAANAHNDGEWDEWCKSTEGYARRQISKYQSRKRKIQDEAAWAKKSGVASEEEMLDLTYRVWVFEAGYEHSKFQMYAMMCNMVQVVLAYERKRNGAK